MDGKRGNFLYDNTWFLYLITTIAVILFIVVWPGYFFFLNDDFVHIPQSGKGIMGQNNSVRHVGDLSLISDYLLFRKNPFGYHLTNLLIHFLNVILFGRLIHLILPSLEKWTVTFIIIGFAFYGFHSEAIFWIIGRSASLGFLFLALAVLCLFQVSKSFFFITLYFTCWFLALFSYESVWIWVPIISLLFWLQPKNDFKNFTIRPFIYFGTLLVFIGYLVIRKNFTGSWLGTYEAAAFEELNIKPLFINYFKLILRTLFPPLNNGWIFVFITALLQLPVLYCIVKKYKSFLKNVLWLGMLFCWLISYIPYLSLGISFYTPESERFLYLPAAFFVCFYICTLSLGFNKNSLGVFKTTGLLFLIIHCLWFIDSSIKYRKAGSIVEASYTKLCNLEKCRTITLRNIPETIYGLPTFRAGFSEGAAWLCNEEWNEKKLIIESRVKFDNAEFQIKAFQNGDACTIEFTPDL